MIINLDGNIIDLSEWMEEGRIKQQKYIGALIEKYYLKLKMQQTLRIIEKILNDKY